MDLKMERRFEAALPPTPSDEDEGWGRGRSATGRKLTCVSSRAGRAPGPPLTDRAGLHFALAAEARCDDVPPRVLSVQNLSPFAFKFVKSRRARHSQCVEQ